MTQTLHQQARDALDAGNRAKARRLLREAIRQTPNDYQTWLLLAHATQERRAALAYVERAYALQPHSPAVRRARLVLAQQLEADEQDKRRRLRPILFTILTVVVVAAAGLWLARGLPFRDSTGTGNPAPLAFAAEADVDEQPQLSAAIAKTTPDVAATVAAAVAAISATETAAAPTATPLPTETPPPTATLAPTASPAQAAAPAANAAWSIRPPGVGANERWIDVNLTTQTLVAYEGDVPIMTSLVSSGTWQHPTVAGQFRTWLKYESQTMNGYLLGYDYYLENVPYVMYFFQDYAIHGAYWHNNFGTPMSHGCVNMSPYEAGLLFEWAPLGTLVNVHY